MNRYISPSVNKGKPRLPNERSGIRQATDRRVFGGIDTSAVRVHRRSSTRIFPSPATATEPQRSELHFQPECLMNVGARRQRILDPTRRA